MKILHINFSDNLGGAANVARGLHEGLLENNINSKLFVRKKFLLYPEVFSTNDLLTNIRNKLNIQMEIFFKRIFKIADGRSLSINFLPDLNLKYIFKSNPDIVNLHWINGGFLGISTISKINKPIVWTFHDMWPFSSTEHYNSKYINIDSVGSSNYCTRIIDSYIARLKFKKWHNHSNFNLVTPSYWLKNTIKDNSLFGKYNIDVINNGIDISIFNPKQQILARNELSLDVKKQIILFGAIDAITDKRKGFDLLSAALTMLKNPDDNIEIVIFGSKLKKIEYKNGFKTYYLGTIKDQKLLSTIYSAADVFILPSRIENLPNTAIEAIASGTPAVAFNVGGLPEIIEHKINGYLAEPFSIIDLAEGINWILNLDKKDYQKLRFNARASAERKFDISLMVKKYSDLYKKILS